MYDRYRNAISGEVKAPAAPPVRSQGNLKWEQKDLSQTLRASEGWHD
jgi:hypothetical protein